jgi:dUTP pyrophosphatase
MGNYTSKIVWGEGGEAAVVPTSSPPSPFVDLVIPVTLEDGAAIPEFKTAAAAGMDLSSSVNLVLEPNVPTKVDTGVCIALPWLCYGQIQGRSSVAAKNVDAFPGVIDADYRGRIQVLLTNRGSEPYAVARGDRVAQLLVLPVARPVLERVDSLVPTARGDGGFGSTD